MTDVACVLVLVAVFHAKHFVADYPLQTHPFFLGKFREDWSFVFPLAVHCAIHGGLTFLIAVVAGAPAPLSAVLGALNATVHFVMDRIKAGRTYLGRWKALSAREFPTATDAQKRSNALFWNALGFDQFIHGLTDLACVFLIVTR